MNPPDGSIATFINEWLWAPLLGLISWAWSHHSKRVDDLRKESKKHVDELRAHVDLQDNGIREEVNRQRDVSGKLFDKLDEHARRSEERHIELLNRQQDMLSALHEGLSRKEDKR